MKYDTSAGHLNAIGMVSEPIYIGSCQNPEIYYKEDE